LGGKNSSEKKGASGGRAAILSVIFSILEGLGTVELTPEGEVVVGDTRILYVVIASTLIWACPDVGTRYDAANLAISACFKRVSINHGVV
jgi:hypothetical protein